MFEKRQALSNADAAISWSRGREWLRKRLALWVSVGVLGTYGCDEKSDGSQVPRSERVPLAATKGAVLPVEAGPLLIRQCTRIVPGGVSGFWQPSQAVIDELEARFPAVVDSVLRLVYPADSTKPHAGEYYRQYIGISRGERHTIYVNAFLQQQVATINRPVGSSAPNSLNVAVSDTFEWRTQPVDACDGGTRFFGVEYDQQSRAFGRIEFNDRVSGPVRY